MYGMESVIDQLIWRYEELLLKAEGAEHPGGKRTDDKAFRYIPLSPKVFIKQLRAATPFVPGRALGHTAKFIDVGCGIGSKVLLADHADFGITAKGIEFRKEYIELARRVAGNSDKIIHGDAFDHDFKPYDIIYFYCPIHIPDQERKLEEHLFKTAKKGALFLANNAHHFDLWGDKKKVRKLWEHVLFQKI